MSGFYTSKSLLGDVFLVLVDLAVHALLNLIEHPSILDAASHDILNTYFE
jgi:hypothetical protein